MVTKPTHLAQTDSDRIGRKQIKVLVYGTHRDRDDNAPVTATDMLPWVVTESNVSFLN